MKKGGKFEMDFSEVIKNRYSCKKFSEKKVEKEKQKFHFVKIIKSL